jgi:hypothetical protein
LLAKAKKWLKTSFARKTGAQGVWYKDDSGNFFIVRHFICLFIF